MGIMVVALAAWKLRLVVALLFSAMILAAAMRPTIVSLPNSTGEDVPTVTVLGAIVARLASRRSVNLSVWEVGKNAVG